MKSAPGVGGGSGKCQVSDLAFRGSPDRIRTGVTALRGRRPRPLDDGAVHIPTGMKSPVGPRYWHGQRRTDYRLATVVANRRSRRRAQRGDQVDCGFDHSPFPLAGRPSARIVVSWRPTRMSRHQHGTPDMNKRGRGSRPRCQLTAGVPGLEPRLTGPEPVGLPITPYPNGIRTRWPGRAHAV